MSPTNTPHDPRDDPTIFSRSLDAQIQVLMVEPLSFAPPELIPKLIIIDGLDECVDLKAQKCILQALTGAATQLNVSVRFLVASRPEQAIRTSFNASSLSRMTKGLPLDGTYKPDADIKAFLNSRFSEIRGYHPSSVFLPKIWPPKDTMDILATKSSGQFIYASTVMKFIESHHHRPSDRLDIILGVSKSENDAPFAELDAVYHHVLSNIAPHNREKVMEVLTFLILTSEVYIRDREFYNHRPRTIERVLRYQQGDLYIYLLDMQSIVHVPEPSCIEELRFYHASFPDFLWDQSRSREHFIDIGKAHAHLTICWWRYWEDQVRYLDRDDNVFITQTLLHHWTRSTLTSTLLERLCTIDLNELLDDIHGVNLEKLVAWNSLYHWMKKEFPDPTKNPLRMHISAFKNWVHTRLQRYPTPFRTLFYAALTVVEHHDDLPTISKILIEMVLEPSESARNKFQRLDEELLYFAMPGPLATLFRTHQEYCGSHEAAGDLGIVVDGDAYAELAMNLAQFLILIWKEPYSRWIINFESAEYAAWNTLTTIRPRAAYLPALDSLLQHPVFVGPRKYPRSILEKEHKAASLEYLKTRDIPMFSDLERI